MRVSKILIKGFQQFENFQLDLTDPETGEPLEKICLIGPNGTGKSTILTVLLWVLRGMSEMPIQPILPGMSPKNIDLIFRNLRQSLQSAQIDPRTITFNDRTFLAIKIHADYEVFFAHIPLVSPEKIVFYQSNVEEHDEWKEFWQSETNVLNRDSFCLSCRMSGLPMANLSGLEDTIIYEPSDQSLVLTQDPPLSPLNEALQFFQGFPVYHTVSVDEASGLWKALAYLLKKWESDYLSFLHQAENSDRTIGQLEAEFAQTHQQILPRIAELWNKVLGKCGLEFDLARAIKPVQLNESFQGYVKSRNTGEQLSYNQLSSGIRQYIFKLGHIQALYFDREIKRGFLLIDEPENCLYPDLLYDLMDDYWSIIENTQTVVSTHSPIIAAQFEPYERFHLDFDDRGYVTATRGVSPIGDDPNDLLFRDFQVRSIYGKKGLEKWERFRELRQLIRAADDPAAKEALMSEYTEIANAYNFPVPR
jgi:energy-coupling factor transporter ATP-binding protein EcfA2